jgi:acyl-CoA synthetase (NDP forming)
VRLQEIARSTEIRIDRDEIDEVVGRVSGQRKFDKICLLRLLNGRNGMRSVPDASLRALVAPTSIAILGASDRPSGALSLIRSLQRMEFSGAIYPVNPRYETVAGLICYPSIADVPTPPDVVACCLNASRIPDSMAEIAKRGARAAVIYDGGFAERGEEGRRAQDVIAGICRDADISLCGPNGLGILNPTAGSTSYFSELRNPARLRGNVGLVSQSGSICNGMMADVRRFGFSLVVSCGNEAVTETAAYLEYLIDDAATRVIATFTESVRDPGRYVDALDRAAVAGKPVVVLKVGRSERTRAAIHTHTGGLAGESHIFSEVLRAHRAIEVSDLDEMTEVLAACQGTRWPHGRRIGLTSGSGGQCELILDLAGPRGIALPPLSPCDRAEAERIIGPVTGDGNPLDYWGNGNFRTNLPHALSVLNRGDAHDAIVYCVDSHDDQPMVSRERLLEYAELLATAARASDKPHYLMNMRPGVMHQAQVTFLREHGVPLIGGTRQGLGAIDRLGRYAMPLAPLLTPPSKAPPQLDHAARTINEFESKRLLAGYGLPVAREHLVVSEREACAVAAQLGFPVALKAVGDSITHKTEYGLVALGIDSEEKLSRAWEDLHRRIDAARLGSSLQGVLVQEYIADGVEVFAGITRDPEYGMFLAFGIGGIDVEVRRDFALRVLPLREGDAEALIAATGAAVLLAPHRGRKTADAAALAQCLYALADFATAASGRVGEIDLNPIKVLPEGQGCIIVDALIVTTPIREKKP